MLRNVARSFSTKGPLVPKKVSKVADKPCLSEAIAGAVIMGGTGLGGLIGFRAGLTDEKIAGKLFFCSTFGVGGVLAGSCLTAAPILALGPTAGSVVAIGLFAVLLQNPG